VEPEPEQDRKREEVALKVFWASLVLAAAVSVAASALASDAPAELHDKTIVASWVAHNDMMTPRGERNVAVRVERLIYVSSLGRTFFKSTFAGPRGERNGEAGPDEKTPKGGARTVEFAGNQLVAIAQNGTGAGRMVITFGDNFSTCKVDVTLAKPESGHLMKRGPGGGKIEILASQFSDQSCAIKDGNLVAQ